MSRRTYIAAPTRENCRTMNNATSGAADHHQCKAISVCPDLHSRQQIMQFSRRDFVALSVDGVIRSGQTRDIKLAYPLLTCVRIKKCSFSFADSTSNSIGCGDRAGSISQMVYSLASHACTLTTEVVNVSLCVCVGYALRLRSKISSRVNNGNVRCRILARFSSCFIVYRTLLLTSDFSECYMFAHFSSVRKHWAQKICYTTTVTAASAFLYSLLFITPQYRSVISALFRAETHVENLRMCSFSGSIP